MPRGFSENQVQSFKNKLLAAAFEALKTTGVRKTTVQDLTKEVGLSTGAFYKFFPSKEALFFEVYEIAEERLKAEFMSAQQISPEASPSALQSTLKQIFRSDSMQALLRLMQKDELDYLLRVIDPERIERHVQGDHEFMQNVIDLLGRKGLNVKMDASLITSYMQALFVLCYEKDLYRQHAERIIDTFIDTIVAEGVA